MSLQLSYIMLCNCGCCNLILTSTELECRSTVHLIWQFAFKKKKIIAVVLVPLSNYVSINNNKKKIQVEIKGSRFGSENLHLIIFHYLNHIH